MLTIDQVRDRILMYSDLEKTQIDLAMHHLLAGNVDLLHKAQVAIATYEGLLSAYKDMLDPEAVDCRVSMWKESRRNDISREDEKSE